MMKNYDFLSYCDFLMLLELCRGCRSPGVENPRDSSRLKDKVFFLRDQNGDRVTYIFNPFDSNSVNSLMFLTKKIVMVHTLKNYFS